MTNQQIPLDRVFHALADPTRLTVLERLSHGPATVGQLAESFRMALPSFMQHLGVLEAARLVTSSKSGRVRTYEVAPGALKPAERWMMEQRTVWDRRFNQLDQFLCQLKDQNKEKKK
jgi:DNA-binding transcriptional ArsR family regulator